MTGRTDPILPVLLANHQRFLAFLEARTGSRPAAEDLLQEAFVRALEKGGGLRERESAVAWFYRLLRNALVDRQRAESARSAALRSAADRAETAAEDPLLREEVCRCVRALLPALKPDQADLLRRVDLEGEPVVGVARSLDITANNASVRLHRARKALLREVQRSCRTCAEHGCLDCTCDSSHGNGD